MSTTPVTDRVAAELDAEFGMPLFSPVLAIVANGENRAVVFLGMLRAIELQMFADPSPEWRAVAASIGDEAWAGSWRQLRQAIEMVRGEVG